MKGNKKISFSYKIPYPDIYKKIDENEKLQR